MKVIEDVKLDFIDVLIHPKRSKLSSRSQVDLVREFVFPNSGQVWKGVPIMTSNMDTIGTIEMYNVLSTYQMITCFHKHYELDDYPDNLNREFYMISTGILDRDWIKLGKLITRLNPKFVCVDVANGYMYEFTKFVKKLHDTYPEIVITCGNIVSREMAEELIINCGADIVKVGIGSGSCCTTRIQTGVGMPQLSAVIECSDAAHGVGGCIISDGGIKNAGDVSKAFGAGADFVMLGSMMAGHDESAGEIQEIDGEKVKIFYGMSSDTAMQKYHGGVAKYRSSEGKTVKVSYKGPVADTVDSILGGVRSTCTYIGARRMKDMAKCTTFVRVNRQVNTIYNGKEMK
jgi:GMP reductase